MIKQQEVGAINVLLIPLILVVLLFFGAAGFGYWAFAGRQDYKNNVDKKISVAVATAKQQTQAVDAQQYAEREKQPFNTYHGPQAFGSLIVQYPKTWSAYVAEDSTNNNPIDGYYYPGFVPNLTDPNSSYALRVQVTQESYSDVLAQYTGLLQDNKVSISPVTLPKVPNVTGSRIDGQVTPQKQGSMVVLPLRNMTLKIWTEDSGQFENDFNTYILPNLIFSP
ncbi:MAG TPA: hypothetical protein VHT70_00345 [Candidatus Saccharimonadales bacterium]|jgi:hypothetical protein|nr:hypothetical protein [Candidatus Saccharimonadales bacterium]